MNRPGYASIVPYLVCRDAAAALAFYTRHFGAEERYRLDMPDGTIVHSEIQIGDMVVMLAEEVPDAGILSPLSLGGSPVSFNIYVDNVDRTFAEILADGGTELHAVADQFHGDRSGKLADPFGHLWHIATNVNALTPEEVKAAFSKMMVS